MTVIAAMSKDGVTCVGSNTGYTIANSSFIDSGVAPWIFFGDWALGVTGSMFVLNLLRRHFEKDKASLQRVEEVVNKIRTLLFDADIGKKEGDDATWSYDIWCILVHKSGKIWDIDEGLCEAPIPIGRLWARGSGEQYALGAATALERFSSSIESTDTVKICVDSAIENDLYCKGTTFVRVLGI
jgi:ATP-dependent protease HslVU (ClpYQ) peptidase subunit